MSETVKLVLLFFGGILASSGFWAWLMNRQKKDSAEKRLLKGLAHDRIMYLGNQYLRRGHWITREEYENLNEYLFIPYQACGGNGTAEKLMGEVRLKLDMIDVPPPDYRPC